MPISQKFTAKGHENVTATHESTLEVTTEDFLTPAGDCILGIEAPLAPADLSEDFKQAAQKESASIEMSLEAGDRSVTVTGRGDPDLTFEDTVSMVARTSEYVDDRTIMVEADAAAADLDRELVDLLADGADVAVQLTVE